MSTAVPAPISISDPTSTTTATTTTTITCEPVSVFPKATTLYLDTGNVVNWDKLKRKTNLTPADELKICVGESICRWLTETDREKAQTALVVNVVDEAANPVVDNRDTLKYTLKLFLYFPLSPAETKNAVEFVMTRLGLNYVETLGVAFPDSLEDALEGDDVLLVWSALEELVDDGMILSLGVSDMNVEQLESLCSYVRVKPSIDQISSTTCCAIPEDLKTFASGHDIQLLMHSDRKEILPAEDLRGVLTETSHAKDGEGWNPQWVVRYSSLVKGRGVIKSKGYMLKAGRIIEFH